MKDSLDPNLKDTTQEQQILCDHFTQVVTQQSPDQLLADFQGFWIDGSNSPNENIDLARDTLLSYKVAQESFNSCLYKCCQIFIEEWQKNPETEAAIFQLMALLTRPSAPDANAYWRSRTALRLNERLQGFRKSPQAGSLQHFLGLLQPTAIPFNQLENKSLKSLLYRYPYLYSYSLMSEDSGDLSHSLRRIKAKNTKAFETNLSQYVIDQVRRSRPDESATQSAKKKHKIFSKNNPTFLSDKELNRALQEYLGKVEKNLTNRDLAQHFLNYLNSQVQYYGDFKTVFYQYLTKSFTSSYCTRQFNPLLAKNLENILPTKTDDSVSEFLILRTCTEILNFLVVESSPPYKHITFMNLISNLGAIRTTSLLLKILLICPQVRPQLEKQLWILFKHYEESPCLSVKGLIKIWENYNVALAAYFGKADLSWCLQIPRAK